MHRYRVLVLKNGVNFKSKCYNCRHLTSHTMKQNKNIKLDFFIFIFFQQTYIIIIIFISCLAFTGSHICCLFFFILFGLLCFALVIPFVSNINCRKLFSLLFFFLFIYCLCVFDHRRCR
jgi:hypothetical protein